MKFTGVLPVLVLLSVTMLGGWAAATPVVQSSSSANAAVIPKENIPVYNCISAYFQGIAYRHLLAGHFDRVTTSLGIPTDSPLKDKLNHLTVSVKERMTTRIDLREHEGDKVAWENAQHDQLMARARAVKTLYDNFLDAVEAAGMDRDVIHDMIVSRGREITSVSIFGGTELDERQKSIYRIFEPDTTNPWIESTAEE